MLTLEESTKWLAIQYKQTNIETLLSEIGKIMDTNLLDVIAQFTDKANIDTADGVWLDYIGNRIGIFERPALVSDNSPIGDDDFRDFLRVEYQKTITDCTSDGIRDALLLFFDTVEVDDNQDMTISIFTTSIRSFDVIEAVVNAGIFFKPAAVRINAHVIFEEYFGFDLSGGTPFDQASFIFKA